MATLNIKRVRDEARLPRYMTPGSAGMDLSAAISEAVEVAPGARALVPTGLVIEIPGGYEAQVRPRSGLAVKQGLTVLNAPGTIDSDYRGEVCVALVNLGDQTVRIDPGMRVAQLIVAPVIQVDICGVQEVSDSARGAGGFGHTGGG
jgi:dUTP pyrophosphatase